MAFTDEEKQRIRYHTGYMSVRSAASLSFGIPKPVQTLFLLESAMNLILPVAEDKVRQLLNVLDGIECRLIDAQTRMAAQSIDTLTMRKDEADSLGNSQESIAQSGKKHITTIHQHTSVC